MCCRTGLRRLQARRLEIRLGPWPVDRRQWLSASWPPFGEAVFVTFKPINEGQDEGRLLRLGCLFWTKRRRSVRTKPRERRCVELERFSITLTNLPRHGRARPGYPRLVCGTIDVDARNKSGHDGGGFGSTIS